MSGKRVVTLTINGDQTEVLCEPRQTLLEVLRNNLDFTGTKEGCSNGNCGACTVLMDGRPVVSCLVLAVEAEGAELRTIEGVACGSHLDEVQSAFLEALHCNAESARRDSSSRPKPCSPKIQIQVKMIFDSTWRVICAVAPAMTRSYAVQAAAEKRQVARSV